MPSRFLAYRQKRFRAAAETPAPEHPRHSDREVGGRGFRVRLDGSGIPYRYRKQRRTKWTIVLAGGALAFGAAGYCLASFTQTGGAMAAASSVCSTAGSHDLGLAIGRGAANFNLNVFNATPRDSLAAQTAVQLKQRGFTVDLVSNDPLNSNLSIPAEVRGSKWDLSELRQVAAQVPGARIETDARRDPSVDLVLGSGFTGLSKIEQASCTP
jgi:hypothetical protein